MATRRRFLVAGLAAVAGLALAAVGVRHVVRLRRVPRPFDRDELAEHLRRTYAYLRPEPAEVDRFVELYLAHYNAAPMFDDVAPLENTFLLSTNFFQSGQPAAGPIRFVAFYHPYVSPCYNPLVQAGQQS